MADKKEALKEIEVSTLLIGDTFVTPSGRKVTQCLARTASGNIMVYCQGAKASTAGVLVPETYTDKMGVEKEGYKFFGLVKTVAQGAGVE